MSETFETGTTSTDVDLQDLAAGLGVRGDDRDRRVVVDRPDEVDHLAVDLHRERGLGQTRADRLGHLCHGDGTRKFTLRAVGKCDLNHVPE